MSTLRKNITITEEENEIILDFCKKIGKSFSKVLRMGALFYIKEAEKKFSRIFISSLWKGKFRGIKVELFLENDEQKIKGSLLSSLNFLMHYKKRF